MMISSELIVGNALLAAVEENKQELEFDYFIDYRERLKKELNNRPENSFPEGEHTLASLNAYDVMDTAYIVTPYLRFRPLEKHSLRYHVIEIPNEEFSKNTLKRKLNIYFRNMTPEWLRNVMDEIDQNPIQKQEA